MVPRDQGRDALACSWSSSKLEGRAPDGTVLVRTYFGRDGEDVDGVADDALIAMATRELGQSLGARAEPIFSRVYRFPKSLPQYTVGHMDRVARLDKLLASRRQVVLTGCSYRGVGIPDCIEAAERAAQSVWEYGRERGAA